MQERKLLALVAVSAFSLASADSASAGAGCFNINSAVCTYGTDGQWCCNNTQCYGYGNGNNAETIGLCAPYS
jgi:hypothetical protein